MAWCSCGATAVTADLLAAHPLDPGRQTLGEQEADMALPAVQAVWVLSQRAADGPGS